MNVAPFNTGAKKYVHGNHSNKYLALSPLKVTTLRNDNSERVFLEVDLMCLG